MIYKILILLIINNFSYAAMSDSVCAGLVVAEIKTTNPDIGPTEESRMITQWTAICKGLINHIQTSADINLTAGDIGVPALGLISAAPGAPVTGAALTGAAVLSGKLQ